MSDQIIQNNQNCDCSNYETWSCPKCDKKVEDMTYVIRALDGGSVICCGEKFHYCQLIGGYSNEPPIHFDYFDDDEDEDINISGSDDDY
jgi:hypothetical protein